MKGCGDEFFRFHPLGWNGRVLMQMNHFYESFLFIESNCSIVCGLPERENRIKLISSQFFL